MSNFKKKPGTPRVNAKKHEYNGMTFDSGFELDFYKNLEGVVDRLDQKKPEFTVLIPRRYTPDFKVGRYYIETKGVIDKEWRTMFEVWCQQNSDKLQFFILVFYKDNKFPRSKLTYVKWAKGLGVHCCVGTELPDKLFNLICKEVADGHGV